MFVEVISHYLLVIGPIISCDCNWLIMIEILNLTFIFYILLFYNRVFMFTLYLKLQSGCKSKVF